MVLFVNGCVRKNSRTLELAHAVLENIPDEMEEIRLYPDGPEGLTEQTLNLRDELLAAKQYDHPMFRFAKQFAAADTIVMAAPYWDLAFPTKIRAYLEEITASGITFRYGPDGFPRGLCRAKRLIYVTTAGGPIVQNFGFAYVKTLAQLFYGIPEALLVKAEGLDMGNANSDEILAQAKQSIPAILKGQSNV